MEATEVTEATIERLGKILGAQYIGVYDSGHMGAKILRFQTSGGNLVVKLVLNDNPEAMSDFSDNLFGYINIKMLNGDQILPPGFRELELEGGARALVMEDLGQSIKSANQGLSMAKSLWSHFRELILTTKEEAAAADNTEPLFIDEVISAIIKFDSVDGSNVSSAFNRANLADDYGQPALMLLDFTPDNLFLDEKKNRLSFIDPWQQWVYLGHPAVSIGQFITLVKIYKLADHEAIAEFFRSVCLTELPALLNCSLSAVDKALRLGSVLQLTLSAYIREEADPIEALVLREEARHLLSSLQQ